MTRTLDLTELRRLNYKRLRAAGYNCRDATRYKDRKQDIVDRLIDIKRNNNAAFQSDLAKVLS